MPECCLEDRDYVWQLFRIDETAIVSLHTRRFRSPRAVWTINGQPVSGAGNVTVDVTVDRYDGIKTVSEPASVKIG